MAGWPRQWENAVGRDPEGNWRISDESGANENPNPLEFPQIRGREDPGGISIGEFTF